MAEETRGYDLKVLRIEEGKEKAYRVIFGYELGEHPLEIGEEHYDLFRPGKKYVGFINSSGTPDFLGEEDKMANICTVTRRLEKILKDEVVIWENKF